MRGLPYSKAPFLRTSYMQSVVFIDIYQSFA